MKLGLEIFFVEMLHFYLNLSDRFAFIYLGHKRAEFIDEVSLQVFNNHYAGHNAIGGKVDGKTFFRIFNETHIKRQEEYGDYKYQITTGREEGLKGNLFWEFENRLAGIVGAKSDIAVILSIHACLMPNVGKLHELCKKVMMGVV